jgi:16S rRNA processing protein RimM
MSDSPGPGRANRPETGQARPEGRGPRLVAIGTVARAHGLRGDVKVRALTDGPARFDSLHGCVLWDPDRDVRLERRVERVRRQGEHIILKLSGVDGVDAARGLVGRLVAVAESDALPLADGQFYPWQLEGCRVETVDGTRVGEVAGIERSPAHDLWVVADGVREHLVPAVPEIVVDVNLGARRVVIRPPEGLLEL